MYSFLTDNTCNFIALDFHNHDGQKEPYKYILQKLKVFKAHGILSGVYRFKSGKGYNV